MSAKNTGTVRVKLKDLPPLDKADGERIAALRDDEIDFSDIPETVGVAWTRPGSLVATENKKQVSLRIDADVLSFYKSTGRRYQTRMNEVLRRYMEAHLPPQRAISRRRKTT